MGLDVYLYRYENRKETKALEAKYETHYNASWYNVDYNSLSDDAKESIRASNRTFALELGLNEDGSDERRKERIEIPSDKYPDHYFKIGYLRSYNDGGINTVLRNLGLPTLYEIFGRDDAADYVWQPDWQVSLARVKDAIAQLRAMPNLRCFCVSPNDFDRGHNNAITTDTDAMRVYFTEKKKNGTYAYSNIKGYFFHDEPVKVYGLVRGFRKALFGDAMFPCVYVIQEGDNEWYIQALEITQETIEYVLSRPDPDKYYFHWSS